MTFQVGMLGSDGIVLAGDTLWSVSPFLSGYLVRNTYGSGKIRVSDNKRIAIACAGHMGTANAVADALIAALENQKSEYLEGTIRNIGSDAIAKVPAADCQCIIALSDPIPQLYFFQYCRQVAEGLRIISYVHAGDNLNSAIFWTQQYYALLPVSQLTQLGALAVVAANERGSGGVEGLEIVVCDTSGVHRLSDNEARDMESAARLQIKSIGERILAGT